MGVDVIDVDTLADNFFNFRLERENASMGVFSISLMWNDAADLDLHVICPSREEINFMNKISDCGGILDVDMNRGPEYSEEPVENIYWEKNPPSGHYKIYVKNYNNRCFPGHQKYSDLCRNVSFTVIIRSVNGREQFKGSVSKNEELTIFDGNIVF